MVEMVISRMEADVFICMEIYISLQKFPISITLFLAYILCLQSHIRKYRSLIYKKTYPGVQKPYLEEDTEIQIRFFHNFITYWIEYPLCNLWWNQTFLKEGACVTSSLLPGAEGECGRAEHRGKVKPLTLIHKKGKICSENGTHQRTDLGPTLAQWLSKQQSFMWQNLLQRVKRREKGSKEEEWGSGFNPLCK